MSFPSMTLLFCLWLSPAFAYKLPIWNGVLLTDGDNTMDNPNNSPGINYKLEWQSQDVMNEEALMLARLKREIIDKKFKKEAVKPDGKILPKVKPTEPPLADLSDTTPYILEASSATVTKAEKMLLLKEDETTTLTELQKTSKGAGQELDEDETTPLTDLEQTTKVAGPKLTKHETTHESKPITQSENLVTKLKLNPTTFKDLSVLTTDESKKVTKLKQVHPTGSQDTSSQQTSTNNKLLEDITSSLSLVVAFPSSTPAIAHKPTTERDVTTGWFSASSVSSVKPAAAVTHITTSIEEKVHTQYLMRQCMLTILILSVVCTIFIISTIALAAKLSTMKQKNKLRHPVTYTEMRCISSLLPDGDQQNKPRAKRLKTFASNMEESDGDNATLNSFLPDH